MFLGLAMALALVLVTERVVLPMRPESRCQNQRDGDYALNG